jgi:ribosomal protein S18 acetylase RimI-like enzyme
MNLGGFGVIFERASSNDAAEFIRIRGLTRENAVAAARLAQLGVTAQSWADDIRSNTLIGYVARTEREIVGYCFGNAHSGEVVVLALLSSAEDQGIGRSLLRLVVDALISAGHRRLFLGCASDPNVRSHGFYRHLGWRSTGRLDKLGDEELELVIGEQ